jgi:hypothetical protein
MGGLIFRSAFVSSTSNLSSRTASRADPGTPILSRLPSTHRGEYRSNAPCDEQQYSLCLICRLKAAVNFSEREKGSIMKKQPPFMILILFILLLLALLPLIYQQIYTAVVHEHISIPTYSPRGPAHNQVVSCSSAFPATAVSERRSPAFVQNGQGVRCTAVIVRSNFSARLYTSPPAL